MRQLLLRHSIPASLPNALRDALAQYEAWRIRSVFGGWMARTLVLFLGPAMLGMLADRFFDFPLGVRVGWLALATGLPFLAFLWLVLSPVWYGSRETLAAEVDSACPRSRDALRSAVNLLSRAEVQPERANVFLLSRTLAFADKMLADVNTGRLVDWGRTPRWLGALASILVLLGVLWAVPAMQMDLLSRRFLRPWGNYPRPSLTRIQVDAPEEQTLTEGDDHTVNVRLTGRTPEGTGSFLHIVSAKGVESVLPMSPRPNHVFVTHQRNLSESFRFYVTAGDGRSKFHAVGIIARPKIVSLVAQYRYPRYTRLPPAEKPVRFRELKAVEGTRLRITLQTDQPIEESWVEIHKKRRKIRWGRARQRGDFTFTLERSGALKIHLVGQNGTSNRFDAPYSLKVIQDNPPSVSFIEIPAAFTVYQDDLIRFSYRGTDDFGIEEVFIRYKHPDDRESRALSLEFPQTGVKLFQGEAVVEVRELIDRGEYSPPAEGIELSLVMADGKDQTGSTQKLNFRVIADAPDQQYAELNRWLLEFGKGLSDSLQRLRAQRNQLKILIEGLDDNAELSPKQNQMLTHIRRELSRVDVRHPFNFVDRQGPNYRYGIYPLRAGRAAEELMSVPLSFARGGDYVRLIAQSDNLKKRRAALAEIYALLEEQIPDWEAWQEALLASVKENRVQTVSFLLDQFLLRARYPSSSLSQNAEVRAVEEEKQAARLGTIAATIKEIDTFGSGPADELVKQALRAISAGTPETGLAPLFEALQKALLRGGAMSGNLRRPLYEWLNAHPLSRRGEYAAKRNLVPGLRSFLETRAILRGDNHFLNEAQFLLDGSVLQALVSSDAARTAESIRLWDEARPWANAQDVLCLARFVRRELLELQADRKSRRIKVDGAVYSKRWLELREAFLALTTELNAGVYAGLEESIVREAGRIAEQASLLDRWTARLAPPDFDARAAKLVESLETFIQRLEPLALAGLNRIQPQLTALLGIVAENLSAELPRVRNEVAEIDQDVAEASGETRLDLLTDAERKQLYGKPDTRKHAKPERFSFAVSLAQRLETYSLALGQAVDFREQLWAREPQEPTTNWIRAAENVSEMMRYLAERVYDKAAAPHRYAQFTDKVYPGYVREIGTYYREEGLTDLGAVVQQIRTLESGDPKALLDSPAFRRQLLRINKQKSYRQSMEWVDSHRSYLAELGRANRKIPALQSMLNELAGDRIHCAPYWRELYLALDRVSRQEIALGAGAGTGPALAERLSRSIAGVRLLTDGLDPAPDDLKKLPEVIEELERLEKRLRQIGGKGVSPEELSRREDELKDWQGTVLAVQESIESRMAWRPLKFRLRRRYGSKPRFDLMTVRSYLIRNETRWLERVRDEEERTVASRVGLVAGEMDGRDTGFLRTELAWQLAYQLSRRRKSMTAQSQSSRGVPFDLGGEGTRVPKMPDYLYKELRRSIKKNYPQHFRELGLKYIRGLSEDAF